MRYMAMLRFIAQQKAKAALVLCGVMIAGSPAGQAYAQNNGAGSAEVQTQTVDIGGQTLSFAVPPGFCLVPTNSPYAASFYAGSAAAGGAGQTISQTTLAAFLPCAQVRDPQVSQIVAYQTWAVTTRFGSILSVTEQDNPTELLTAMYEQTQNDVYRQRESAGLEGLARSMNAQALLQQRQDASGVRDSYFYRAYAVPFQGAPGVQQVCAATSYAVVKGVMVRSEQLSPCDPSVDPTQVTPRLVSDVTGQMEYFLALNGKAVGQ